MIKTIITSFLLTLLVEVAIVAGGVYAAVKIKNIINRNHRKP